MPSNEYSGRLSDETAFNSALGEALRCASDRWNAESKQSIRIEQTQVIQGEENKLIKPDILLLDHDMPPVAIETSYCGTDADQDAVGRLGLFPCESLTPIKTAIAVRIPDHFKYRNQNESTTYLIRDYGEFDYAVHQVIGVTNQSDLNEHNVRRWPSRGFIRGDTHDLCQLVMGVALPKEQLECLADEIAGLLDDAAHVIRRKFTKPESEELRDVLFQKTPISALRTCMVVWFNALCLQDRLAKQGVREAKPLNLDTSSIAVTYSERFLIDWLALNKTNWRSILEPAIKTLHVLTNMVPKESSFALQLLVSGVKKLHESRVALNMNIGAELIPKLSEDQIEAAAFYTHAASAELLTHLTVNRYSLLESEWRSTQIFRDHSLADLACGTGTLLRTGYKRIKALHLKLCDDASRVPQLHVDAMEHGLIGTDINPIAAHLTASSLAMLGNGSPYAQTRVGWLGVGGHESLVGSLELLQQNEILDETRLISASGRSDGEGPTASSIRVSNDQLDWVVMNPPYSHTKGEQSAFDIAGLNDSERKACQSRWQSLIRNEPVTETAGLAASFLLLASRKVKPGGRIGLVLPLTAAFAQSWQSTRRMIEETFEGILLVTHQSSHALGSLALSADTKMEEMLLVATRRRTAPDLNKGSNIHYVTLKEPTTRCGEAAELARIIENTETKLTGPVRWSPILVGDDEVGHIASFATKNDGAAWDSVGDASFE